MKLIFLGPPGAGKGTLAARAVEALGLPHISTGELFRAAIREGTELGRKVKEIIDAGSLAPDELTIALVKERLSRPDAQAGWILDGFPRTIAQAQALSATAPADAVVDFSLDDAQVVTRLSGRRVCRSCARNFNVNTLPPKVAGKCDACGGELFIRDDDREEAIRNRLDVYRRQTEPLIEYYRARGKLLTVDAGLEPAAVFSEFMKAIKRG